MNKNRHAIQYLFAQTKESHVYETSLSPPLLIEASVPNEECDRFCLCFYNFSIRLYFILCIFCHLQNADVFD